MSGSSVLVKRSMTELRTNSFIPWITSLVRSNMDLQFIVEEYSYSAYVVDYMNKTKTKSTQSCLRKSTPKYYIRLRCLHRKLPAGARNKILARDRLGDVCLADTPDTRKSVHKYCIGMCTP